MGHPYRDQRTERPIPREDGAPNRDLAVALFVVAGLAALRVALAGVLPETARGGDAPAAVVLLVATGWAVRALLDR